VLEFFYLFIPLFFLFFFQSKLRKGIAQSSDKLIQEGLNFLLGFLIIQVVFLISRLIFGVFILPYG